MDFFPSMDSPSCLAAPQSLLLASPIKTHQVSALEIQFSCSVDSCQRGEAFHLFFFLGIHCSHLFLSYPNTMGLMISKSSHMLIFFLTAGQDFICSCLLSRLPASIYSNRKFFSFFFLFFMNTLVWLCASFPLLSVLLLCSACAFPGCISSFIWEGVSLVGKMLALQFVIPPFPPILLHHSNPNFLSSVFQPFSVPWFFWGPSLGSGTRCIF